MVLGRMECGVETCRNQIGIEVIPNSNVAPEVSSARLRMLLFVDVYDVDIFVDKIVVGLFCVCVSAVRPPNLLRILE